MMKPQIIKSQAMTDLDLYFDFKEYITQYIDWCKKLDHKDFNVLLVIGKKKTGKSSFCYQMKEVTEKRASPLLLKKKYISRMDCPEISFGYQAFYTPNIFGDQRLSFYQTILNSLCRNKSKFILDKSNIQIGLNHYGSLSFERQYKRLNEVDYIGEILKLIKKYRSRVGDKFCPFVFFIDNVHRIEERNFEDKIKGLFERANDGGCYNVYFVLSGELNYFQHLTLDSIPKSIIEIVEIPVNNYFEFADLVRTKYNVIIRESVISKVYETGGHNLGSIMTLLNNIYDHDEDGIIDNEDMNKVIN